MRIIKRFESFISEEFVMADPETKPVTAPPTTTPDTRPSRPGVTPTTIPSEQDAPLASAQEVIDRLSRVYSESSEEEKQKIDNYFQEK